MRIADSLIKEKCQNDHLIAPFYTEQLGSSSYDLKIEKIIIDKDGKFTNAHKLKSGESVFVSTKETVNIPHDLIGLIENKTSRLRQGLEVLATPHQPGINTRIFIKVSNTSNEDIEIREDQPIAQIYFEELKGVVENPYNGTFNKEKEFKGLAGYSTVYLSQRIEETIKAKSLSLENLESKLYGVVATLMAVFVAIMSIISFNGNSSGDVKNIFVGNLMVVSSMAFLFGVISLFIPSKAIQVNKPTKTCFFFSLLAFCVGFAVFKDIIPISF